MKYPVLLVFSLFLSCFSIFSQDSLQFNAYLTTQSNILLNDSAAVQQADSLEIDLNDFGDLIIEVSEVDTSNIEAFHLEIVRENGASPIYKEILSYADIFGEISFPTSDSLTFPLLPLYKQAVYKIYFQLIDSNGDYSGVKTVILN